MDNYELCEEHVEMYTNVLFYLRAAKALLLRTTEVVGRAGKLSGTWNLVPQMQFLSSKNLKCNFWRQKKILLGHLK